MDCSILDKIIVGRVEPHIYAFSTNTIPNYLKVGDTYRPVSIRLKEWKTHYPMLKEEFDAEAKIGEVFFRDYAVHTFLEREKQKKRLHPADVTAGTYYSKEFFKDTSPADIEEAICDIKTDYANNEQKYLFYSVETLRPEDTVFARTDSYLLRPNQKATVNAFQRAVKNGHHNLLMYAVMRFGKSFTSMCCAVKIDANLVVVVSAKADVMTEWKKTVESHTKFSKYDFVTAKNLSRNYHTITEKLSSGRKVVVFLTLQDLKGDKIKDRHQEVFGQEIDLLLVDETHFGARAEKYGEVLKSAQYIADIKYKKDADDFVEASKADAMIKILKAKNTIHLSGTPYRILMGSEFTREDIIAFYQFIDIVKDQQKWDKKHILDDNYKEWENPYYGFPQMVRFAFVPNESSRIKLENLKKSGTTYAFSALFRPKSISKADDALHKQFLYEREICDLFSVIDGSKDDDCLLGFLDFDNIKNGNMCRHIVIVLPYCASCDALEAMLKKNADKFKNLCDYEIVNISGVDNPVKYKTATDVKRTIAKFEEQGKKTITLTVNRMLTGSTVPEWDTMLFFKDTASPQEYDQAIFRLQNQYIKTYVDKEGNTIKYNMKPQTLLVDFDPNRMFVMQEKKSKIYNINTEKGGNSELRSRIKRELDISPIITVNADKIVKVKAVDILEAVSNYQKDKGIKEEALDIPVDLGVLDNDLVRYVIERENEIGSRSGLSATAYEREDNADSAGDMAVPDAQNGVQEKDGDCGNNRGIYASDQHNYDGADSSVDNAASFDEQRKKAISLSKKIQSYYTRILLFAFITKDAVISLSDILDKIGSEENARIAKNLGLNVEVLTLLNTNTNKFVLSDLDYKIQNLNKLSRADDMSPAQKASVAVSKFGKLGDAIVITPSKTCAEMVDLLPDDLFKHLGETRGKLLDIAGTAGEYAVALCNKMRALGIDNEVIANSIYTIPKSPICFELVRKLYEMLGLNTQNIAKEFVATDLLEIKDGNNIDYDKITALLTQNKSFATVKLTDTPKQQGESNMIKFDAVVGNPPYQGVNHSQIYPFFYLIAKEISSNYVSLIFPTGWQEPKNANNLRKLNNESIKHDRQIVNINNCQNVFPGINGAEWVNIILWKKGYDNSLDGAQLILTNGGNPLVKKLSTKIESISKPKEILELGSIIQKTNGFQSVQTITSMSKPYGLRKDVFDRLSYYKLENMQLSREKENDIKIYGSNNTIRYVPYEYALPRKTVAFDKYKVFVGSAWGNMSESAGLGGAYANIIIGSPFEICTETYQESGAFEEFEMAKRHAKYLMTKFARALLYVNKVSQMSTRSWGAVPIQDYKEDWWGCSIDEIDKRLIEKYNISEDIADFIDKNIQRKTEENIVNYGEGDGASD